MPSPEQIFWEKVLHTTVTRRDAIAVGLGVAGALVAERAFGRPQELLPQNVNFVDWLGRQRRLSIFQGTYGINPPNPSNKPVDTIEDWVDGVYTDPFQGYVALYPELSIAPGRKLTTDALLTIPNTKVLLLANTVGTSMDGSTYKPRIEVLVDNTKTTEYTKSARIVVSEGLPQGGTIGNTYNSFTYGIDANGIYAEVEIIQSIIPTENGIYRMRLDSNGLPASGFVQIHRVAIAGQVFKNTQVNR